jgi:hypothetical protein
MFITQVGLPLLGGGALLTYAALNYHTTLKFVGVLGVMLTVANKLLSYDSPKDAFEDITGGFQCKGRNKAGKLSRSCVGVSVVFCRLAPACLVG